MKHLCSRWMAESHSPFLACKPSLNLPSGVGLRLGPSSSWGGGRWCKSNPTPRPRPWPLLLDFIVRLRPLCSHFFLLCSASVLRVPASSSSTSNVVRPASEATAMSNQINAYVDRSRMALRTRAMHRPSPNRLSKEKNLEAAIEYQVWTQQRVIPALPAVWTQQEATSMNDQGDGYVTADVLDPEAAALYDEVDYEWVLPELPAVRLQDGPTCVFNSTASMVEFQIKGAVIDVESFVNDYKKMINVQFGKDHNRVIMALKMFQDHGVLANCNGRETRLYISGYKFHLGLDEYQVFSMIRSGTSLLGSFAVQLHFFSLGSDIYKIRPGEPITGTHIVMFVGFGMRKGRPYLVFQNSYGLSWGTQGLGRIYFDQVCQLKDNVGFQLITVTVDREVGTSLAAAEPPSPQIPAPEDKPVPRFEISDQMETYGYACLARHRSGPDEGDMFHKMLNFAQLKKDVAITTDELPKLLKSYQEKALAHDYEDASGATCIAEPGIQTR